MSILALGFAVFVGIHLLPALPSVRQTLTNRLGVVGYKVLFAAIALLGLVLIVAGKASADFVSIWYPPAWSRHATSILMLISFMLLPAVHLPSNVKRFTRHPMLWSITIWSIAHLLANGDLASMIVFGGFGAFALLAMWSANMRGATKSIAKYSLARDAVVVVVGLVAYSGIVLLHPYLFGVAVIS